MQRTESRRLADRHQRRGRLDLLLSRRQIRDVDTGTGANIDADVTDLHADSAPDAEAGAGAAARTTAAATADNETEAKSAGEEDDLAHGLGFLVNGVIDMLVPRKNSLLFGRGTAIGYVLKLFENFFCRTGF